MVVLASLDPQVPLYKEQVFFNYYQTFVIVDLFADMFIPSRPPTCTRLL